MAKRPCRLPEWLCHAIVIAAISAVAAALMTL
jgi:hypothetical protein